MDALRNTLAEMLRERFDASLTGCDAIEAGLGSRRFYRLSLTGAASKSTPTSMIARVDAPEDPALRPAGVPPEPPLEPLRSFLADHGVPVPERYAGDEERGIELLEDLGSLSLEIAANEAGEKTGSRSTERPASSCLGFKACRAAPQRFPPSDAASTRS